jgi:hypothetical protein
MVPKKTYANDADGLAHLAESRLSRGEGETLSQHADRHARDSRSEADQNHDRVIQLDSWDPWRHLDLWCPKAGLGI